MGVFMAFAALGFILPIRYAERAFDAGFEGRPGLAAILVVVVPVGGALLGALVLTLLPVRVRGHGITQVLYAINRTQSAIPLRVALRQWLGSSCTIASGGSAGPEGPIVTIGATLGSAAARILRVDRPATTTLLGCGAAAGLSAVFAAPLTGIFFVLEVLLRDFSLRTFTPIVVASVLSFATIRAVLGGGDPVFGADVDAVRKIGADISVAAVPALGLLALICAVGSIVFVRGIERVEKVFGKLAFPAPLKPALGALWLGAGAAAWVLISGKPQMPPFMGAGYQAMDQILAGGVLKSNAMLATAALLLFWFGTKVLATGFTLGSGGAGGLFAPALMAGASLGGAFGCLAAAVGIDQPGPAVCALAGMGCMVAGTTHAPMAGAMLVYELSRNESIVLPALLCTVVATLATKAIYPYSMYTAPLASMGIRHGEMGDMTLLRRMTVSDLAPQKVETILPSATGEDLLRFMERTAAREVVAAEADGRPAGLVTVKDLQALLVYREAAAAVTVADIMHTDSPATWPEETLDVVFQKLAARDLETLIVLERRGARAMMGVITRDQVVRAYDEALRAAG